MIQRHDSETCGLALTAPEVKAMPSPSDVPSEELFVAFSFLAIGILSLRNAEDGFRLNYVLDRLQGLVH